MARPDEDALHTAPVYNQLSWRWTWRGLGGLHVGLIFGPVFVLFPVLRFMQMGFWPSVPLGCAFLPSLALAVFVGVAQLGRHPDALSREIRRLMTARSSGHLSPFIDEADEGFYLAQQGKQR